MTKEEKNKLLLRLYELLWEEINDKQELKCNISLFAMVNSNKKEYRVFMDDFPYQCKDEMHDKVQTNIIKNFIINRIKELKDKEVNKEQKS